MAVKPISIAIVGDDRNVQKTFDRVTRRAVQVASTGERFAAGVRKFSDDAGVTKLAAGFQSIGRRVTGAVESMGRFAPALAGITGAASIAGLARLVETWTGFGARLGLDAQRIGIASRNLHGLQGAARLAGSSAEALTSGMTTLGDNLVDAVGGRSPETIQMLSTLGIAFQDASGHARTAEAVLPELADKIAALKTPALQARAATALFGGAGEALLPFLRRGAAGIADYNAQALRYGAINEEGVRAANAMREAQARLGLAVDGVGYSVAERVAPILVPMLNRLSEWISAHRKEIADFFGDIASRIARWVDSGGIDRVTTAVTNFGTQVGAIVEGVGGATNAIELFFALWIGAKAIGTLAAIGRMAGALRGLAGVVSIGGALTTGLAYLTARGWMDSGKVVERDAQLRAIAGERARDVMQGAPQDGFSVDGTPITDAQTDKIVDALDKIDRHITGTTGRGGAVAGATGSSETVPLTPGQQAQNARSMAKVLMDEGGFTREGAAALLGGGIQESGLNPTSGAGTAHQGIFQWSNERRAAIEAQFRKPVTSMTPDEQARAAIWELQNRRGFEGINTKLRTSHDLGVTNYAATHDFESPGNYGVELPRRLGLSKGVLDRLNYDASRPAIPGAATMAPPAPPVQPMVFPGGTQGAAGANGQAVVRLEHVNPPAGLKTSVQTSGDVQYGGLRIERQQVGNAP